MNEGNLIKTGWFLDAFIFESNAISLSCLFKYSSVRGGSTAGEASSADLSADPGSSELAEFSFPFGLVSSLSSGLIYSDFVFCIFLVSLLI